VQRAALSGDDEPALVEIAYRRAVLAGITAAAEASLNELGAKITEAEAELAEARDKADRERRASALEAQMAALAPLFDQWLDVSGRFAQELAQIHGVLDAHNAAMVVRQCRDGLAEARGMLASEVRATAWQIRNPPPKMPEPPLPAGVVPAAWGIPQLDVPHEL
jgi:hypothetical protein